MRDGNRSHRLQVQAYVLCNQIFVDYKKSVFLKGMFWSYRSFCSVSSVTWSLDSSNQNHGIMVMMTPANKCEIRSRYVLCPIQRGIIKQLLLDSSSTYIMILPVWQYHHLHFKNMHKFSDDMDPNSGPAHGFKRVDSLVAFYRVCIFVLLQSPEQTQPLE